MYPDLFSFRGFLLASTIVSIVAIVNCNNESIIEGESTKQNAFYLKQMISFRSLVIFSDEATSGYITSPSYPNPFPINSSSMITLIISDSNVTFRGPDTIRLIFEDLDIETANFCDFEAIEVLLLDGLNDIQSTNEPSKKLIFKLCGSVPPKPMILKSHRVMLRLFSDGFTSGKSRGFKMKFEFLNSLVDLHGTNCDLPGYFRCRNRNCIREELKCNRVDDCGDASDEDVFTPCDKLPLIPYKIDYLCGQASLSEVIDSDEKKRKEKNYLSNFIKNRIVGGIAVNKKFGWPFTVSIQLWRVESVSHLCGGTLIHPMFVISAAHCFRSSLFASDYKLIFGAKDLTNTTSRDIQVRYANFITLFPGNNLLLDLNDIVYRQADLSQDLALIELNAPVKLGAHVWPACLPHLLEPIQVSRECLNSGFGDTRGTNHAFKLKQVSLVIKQTSDCNSELSGFEIDQFSMICAKSKTGEGPCNGDSGGPLFCSDGPDDRPIDINLPEVSPDEDDYNHGRTSYDRLKPGDVIKYLPYRPKKPGSWDNQINRKPDKNSNRSRRAKRYTVHGVTSFSTAGNLGGGFCGVEDVSTIYTRVSTKVDWILSQMKLALLRLNEADCLQDPQNNTAFFGYMFRSGVSRHVNFTPPLTVYSND